MDQEPHSPPHGRVIDVSIALDTFLTPERIQEIEEQGDRIVKLVQGTGVDVDSIEKNATSLGRTLKRHIDKVLAATPQEQQVLLDKYGTAVVNWIAEADNPNEIRANLARLDDNLKRLIGWWDRDKRGSGDGKAAPGDGGSSPPTSSTSTRGRTASSALDPSDGDHSAPKQARVADYAPLTNVASYLITCGPNMKFHGIFHTSGPLNPPNCSGQFVKQIERIAHAATTAGVKIDSLLDNVMELLDRMRRSFVQTAAAPAQQQQQRVLDFVLARIDSFLEADPNEVRDKLKKLEEVLAGMVEWLEEQDF